jgi:hypothetical protein
MNGECPLVALSRLIRARASAAIGGKADPDQTTLEKLNYRVHELGRLNKSVSGPVR